MLKYCYKVRTVPPSRSIRVTTLTRNKYCCQILHLLLGKLRWQLVKCLVIIICRHVVKVYNYASTPIIYKVNRHSSFLPIIFFHKKMQHE